MSDRFNIGLPMMHMEAGERRAFLPDFVAKLEKIGANLVLERGYGVSMGLSQSDYTSLAPGVRFVSGDEAYDQDYVLILRCPPEDYLRKMHQGACLISMLHYPTRPERVAYLRSLGLEAISMDSIKDDSGRRIVENLRAVAWNGLEIAFQTLKTLYPSPGFESPERNPLQVTVLGSGAVGTYVTQAAIRYANEQTWHDLAARNVPGVQVTTVDFDTTRLPGIMGRLLARTDILVDATQRPNPSRVVIPNDWIQVMPAHAVLLDLSVDPYACSEGRTIVKGIEGIPQGNLDQYIFRPDDPAYDRIPDCASTTHRRFVISCYSWPGIHPRECMKLYGQQLRPLLRTLIEKGGVRNVDPRGGFFERALSRAMLSHLDAPPGEKTVNEQT